MRTKKTPLYAVLILLAAAPAVLAAPAAPVQADPSSPQVCGLAAHRLIDLGGPAEQLYLKGGDGAYVADLIGATDAVEAQLAQATDDTPLCVRSDDGPDAWAYGLVIRVTEVIFTHVPSAVTVGNVRRAGAIHLDAAPPDDCDALAKAEATSMWDYVDKDTLKNCQVDSDCVSTGLTAYICGGTFNKTAVAADQAYRDGVVFQTLEGKFRALECHHLALPCPFQGQAACVNRQCVGRFPPNP